MVRSIEHATIRVCFVDKFLSSRNDVIPGVAPYLKKGSAEILVTKKSAMLSAAAHPSEDEDIHTRTQVFMSSKLIVYINKYM